MRPILLGLFTVACLVANSTAQAGDCCGQCGCQCPVRKVCRLVCEMKTEKKTVYDCKCEDFCVPGPSECVGTKCPTCEDTCKCQCRLERWFAEHCPEKIYKPTCAEVHTKKLLVKKTVEKKVPSYKWVVEYVCDGCANNCCRQNCAMAAEAGEGNVPAPPDGITTGLEETTIRPAGRRVQVGQ